jgi:hypothetical protein
MTIAKLLTLVNEVVPLESSTWGLEDYAVGLSDGQGGSYECLHFQAVSQALKDEDQVMYMALFQLSWRVVLTRFPPESEPF